MAKKNDVTTTTNGTVEDLVKSAAPIIDELAGFITVYQAAQLANVPQSTINYWVRETETTHVQGVNLGKSADASGVLLVNKQSVLDYIPVKAEKERAEKEKLAAKKQIEDEASKLRAEMKRQQDELKAKLAALKGKK